VITSRLAYPEDRSVLAAARRAHRLSEGGLRAGTMALEGRFEEIDFIEVTQEIAWSAGDLAEEHGLRGYDAVYLASALAIDAVDLVVVTWDRDLAEASHAVGFDPGRDWCRLKLRRFAHRSPLEQERAGGGAATWTAAHLQQRSRNHLEPSWR
jgi:predicted nucleic acid-binding protein